MRNFIKVFLFAITIASCETKSVSPLQTDIVTLSPGQKMKVYNDAKQGKTVSISSNAAIADTIRVQPVPFTVNRNPENLHIVQKEEKAGSNVHVMQAPEKEKKIVISTPVKEPEQSEVPAATPVVLNTGNSTYNKPVVSKSDSMIATPTPVAANTEKKGWSNAAKGAVMGGVGGAIGGAVISKKKGKGAIIGGVIGAAGGYILGKTKDNKEAEDNNQ